MSAAGIHVLHVCKLHSIKSIAKSPSKHFYTSIFKILLYAKSEQYAERSSRVEDIYVFPVNTLNQYDEGFIAEGSCLSFLSHDGQSCSLFISMF